MTERNEPRALTYTEMMNSGRQQIGEDEQLRERALQRRIEELVKQVEHLEKSLERGC